MVVMMVHIEGSGVERARKREKEWEKMKLKK